MNNNINIGVTVVCIKDHVHKTYRQGQKFRVKGLREWNCKCNARILLDIGLSDNTPISHFCVQCKDTFTDSIFWGNVNHFVPTIDSSFVEITSEEIIKTEEKLESN